MVAAAAPAATTGTVSITPGANLAFLNPTANLFQAPSNAFVAAPAVSAPAGALMTGTVLNNGSTPVAGQAAPAATGATSGAPAQTGADQAGGQTGNDAGGADAGGGDANCQAGSGAQACGPAGR